MKDLSFFLLKNSFGSKMKKGFRNSCSGDNSTSTANQHRRMEQGSSTSIGAPSIVGSYPVTVSENQPTLEDMILQLELEEKAARRARLEEEYGEVRHRMSCVNSSDILRSARNALNQYPRFSLDGKDAMYRSSFRNQGLRKGFIQQNSNRDIEEGRIRQLPTTIAGENVVWCRPGVVGKLMGLDAMPIPVGRYYRRRDYCGLTAAMKRQHHRWREERETNNKIEKTRFMADTNDWVGKDRGVRGSCSTSGFCFMKPVRVDPRPKGEGEGEGGWPMGRY